MASQTAQGLTLGQLLDHEELDLRFVAGDETSRARVVHGVHGTEVEHPTRWLEPGWVMLTTGMRLQDDGDAGRDLVAELADANLAALGFGTGMTFDTIPEPIVDEAARRGFPLFEVPLATRFNEVIAFAARASLSRDFHVLRRTVSMQNYLIESLSASSPEEELIQRLGAVLDSDIALYRPDGELETVVRRGHAPSPGAVPPAWASQVWDAICERPPTPQHFDLGNSRVVSSPVEAEGRVRYWLVVVSRNHHASERLAQPVVEAAGRLLAVIANARRISVSEEREIRRLFIDELTSGAPAQLDQLGQRAAGLGLDFREPARAVQIVVQAPVARDAEWRPEARLERCLALTHQRFVIATRDDRIICLVQGRDEMLRAALDETEPLFGGAVIGVGRAARSVDELGHSIQDSTVAIAQLASAPGDAATLWFDDFDVLACLMSGAPKDVVRARVDQLLEPMKAKPQLYDTLQCWLDLDLDVGRSAGALHLHPNSMRYRLNRIEEMLGRSLRRPATIANLVVATMFDEMYGDDAPPQTIVRPPSTYST
jgi:Purine catabolism regulatory protein-like family/PucR C-terminal helix-turn-helix domain/GGDEF-like domain